jgi:polyhydroxyalkanoate synthesis repressor PhaR
MPVIKRYPNRKLYDTEAKQYITLDEIAEIIRTGGEVHVVDNATGEDLTALTLSQIIFEQEKKQSGFLPRALLSSLIQAGGDRLNAFQRHIASSIGFGRQVDEEIRRRMQDLVARGELNESEANSLLEKLSVPVASPSDGPSHRDEPELDEAEIRRILAEQQIPTRSDFQRLVDQIDAISAKLDE